MLQPFAKDVWIADGPVVVAIMGFPFGTRMAVIRLPDGGLFVWSPIALGPNLRAQVDALGPVHFIVAPSGGHFEFIEEWATAYPRAQVFGPAFLVKRLAHVRWDGALQDRPEPGWSAEIDQVSLRNGLFEVETVFFHRASQTAIFTDVIEHFDREWFKGWRAVIARMDLMAAAEPEVPRKYRLVLKRSEAARLAVHRILQWPIERVLMAHAPPVSRDGKAFVARCFRWLKV